MPGGRPPIWKSVDGMQELIDDYFERCEGTQLTDKDGKPVLNKYDEPIYLGAKPPTITGLALALGFVSRQSLLEYQAEEEFSDTITRAKARVEAYAEARLFDRDGSNGAKFSLSNNFRGWKETQTQNVNLGGQAGNPVQIDAKVENELSEEQLEKIKGILEG